MTFISFQFTILFASKTLNGNVFTVRCKQTVFPILEKCGETTQIPFHWNSLILSDLFFHIMDTSVHQDRKMHDSSW